MKKVFSPAPDISSMDQQVGFDTSGELESEPMDDVKEHFPDGVVLSKVQIALQRQIGGWPLYTIILGLGQVSCHLCTEFVVKLRP